MFGIGLPEMILILALALIVVGPDKLPELARSVAKGVLELKKTVSSLKEDLAEDNPFDDIKPELEETAESIKKQLGDVTPDGFTGIVKDLEQGLQEVIDTDGSVIPVSTDDIINTVSDSSVTSENKPEDSGNEQHEVSQAEGTDKQGAHDDTGTDTAVLPETDKQNIEEPTPTNESNTNTETALDSEDSDQSLDSSDKTPPASPA